MEDLVVTELHKVLDVLNSNGGRKVVTQDTNFNGVIVVLNLYSRWSNSVSSWWYCLVLFSRVNVVFWVYGRQVSLSRTTEGFSELYTAKSGLYGVVSRVDGIVAWGASLARKP